jgi:hypothetical protein
MAGSPGCYPKWGIGAGPPIVGAPAVSIPKAGDFGKIGHARRRKNICRTMSELASAPRINDATSARESICMFVVEFGAPP